MVLTVVGVLVSCSPAPITTSTPSIETLVRQQFLETEQAQTLEAAFEQASAATAAIVEATHLVTRQVEIAQAATQEAIMQATRQIEAAQTATQEAIVQATRQVEAAQTATQQAVIDPNVALLDHLLATMPETLTAGVTQWRVDKSIEVKIVEREGGLTARISFGESGGGQMELTYGVFSTPEAAMAWYDKQYESLASQSQLEEKSQFSTPNAFSKGTNTSAAIFVRDNIFIRYYVPTFSSTTGEPLTQLAPPVFEILDASLASYTPPS
jgi:hypothetical protein